MIRRAGILLFLALQLATSASPSAALLLCLSNDGCASIEFAVPGSVHCDDRDCDPHIAASDDHSCRDIPVLSAAADLLNGSRLDVHALPPASTPIAVFADHVSAPALALPQNRPPASTAWLRSVVLTL